jgi:two-component system, chemotaxis family, CheB/CheR fusion protein
MPLNACEFIAVRSARELRGLRVILHSVSDLNPPFQDDAATSRERHLVREVNHRVRNMLQVVIGLASQTLRSSSDLASFEKAYLNRLQALARAYELLARQNWRAVPLADLLMLQLPDSVAAERYMLSGPDVSIVPSAALSLGLVLHELATHACQFGAFTQPNGSISVRWSVDTIDDEGERLQLEWLERGSPASAKATTALACELVRRQLKHELHGDASLNFTDTGLVARLQMPCEEVLKADHG